jgi:hypothetical protein
MPVADSNGTAMMAKIVPIRPSYSAWQRLIHNTTRVPRYSNGSREECTGLEQLVSSATKTRRHGPGYATPALPRNLRPQFEIG